MQYFYCLCSVTVVPVNVKGTFAKLGVSVNGAVHVFFSSAMYVFFSSASMLKVRCTFPQFCVNVKCAAYVFSVLRQC